MSGGGKETLRQKMIGMMYIVLTALMAMNVSSSILEKFAIISNNLELSIKTSRSFNTEIINNIKATVKEMGDRKCDVAILDKALQVSKLTNELNEYIDNTKNELLDKVGGVNSQTGFPKDLKADGVVSFYMLKLNKASELKSKINNYVDVLSSLSGVKYNHIALDADEDSVFKENPNQKGKKFGELNFGHTPMCSAIAILNLFQNEIISLEGEIVSKMAKSLGAEDIKFDKFKVIVKPKSSILVAGTKYEADLFLAASSSAVKPLMFVDGRKINVDKDGVGILSFPVSAKSYDKNGLSNQSFKASIALNIGNKETKIEEVVNYSVVQPILEVQAAAVQALYYNCGNELNIKCPSLGNEYNPSFSIIGAEIFNSSKRSLITVVPSGKNVAITVFSNGVNVGILKYGVRSIPKPEIKVLANGKLLNEKDGMLAPGPKILEVQVVPDEGFAQILPNDARYKISEWKVTLARGSKAVSIKTCNGQSRVILSDFSEIARSGDRLVVEIITIIRTTFNNKDEVVAMPSVYKIITLN